MSFLEVDSKPESYLDMVSEKKEVKTSVNCAIEKFKEFSKSEYDGRNMDDVIEGLKSIKKSDEFKNRLFCMLKKYVKFLEKDGLQPVTVRKYFGHFKEYLKYLGFDIRSDDLKENIKLPRVIEAEHYPMTLKIMQAVFSVIPLRHKALFFTLSSSGIRIKESIQLRKRDFDSAKERIKITIPAKISKTGKKRITFVSKETEGFLSPLLNKLKDDDLVFGTNENAHRARQNEEERFSRIRANAGFCNCITTRTKNTKVKDTKNCEWMYQETGHHKITIHSFRHWFIGRTNRIDFGFGHALAGHGLYMSRYDNMDEEELLELYLKSEPTLQIFNRTSEDTELDETKTELADVKQRLDETQNQLKNILKFLPKQKGKKRIAESYT